MVGFQGKEISSFVSDIESEYTNLESSVIVESSPKKLASVHLSLGDVSLNSCSQNSSVF